MFILKMILVGAVAGWLAGQIWKGSGFGLLWNVLLGIGGAFLGGILLRFVGFYATNIIAQIIAALVGSLVILFVASRLRR
jgi:uncharacterized membrane protein YeaQ/YmgE (transglycosylase-associated protein family)